jgi:hypothetical protein
MDSEEETFADFLREAAQLLTKLVVPIYENDRRGRPSLHGSGFFVRHNDHHFLVSAAHVLESLRRTELFYYSGVRTLRTLSGRLLTNPWTGDRDNDPIDVGVLHLSGRGLPPYPEVEKFPMDISYLRPGYRRAGRMHAIVGFPASKSSVNPAAREVEVSAFLYRSSSIPEDEYVSHGCNAREHVCMHLDLKGAVDEDGKHRHFPKPQGMSGAPVFVLYDEDGTNDARVFPVVAVGTKYRKTAKLLVGTDVAVVLDMIRAHLVGE